MISVKKDFNDIPKDLQKDNPKITTHIKKKLNESYHYKCAFCETKATTKKGFDIVQYRPKSLYPWLEFEWSNLLPVCNECNKAKANKFPIEGQPITKAPEKREDYRVDSKLLLSEKPMLVHPEIDTVENHFYIETNGVMYGNTQKGKTTIAVLNLNRNKLIDKRRSIYEDFFNVLDEKFADQNFDLELYFNCLYQLQLPDAEFSLLGNWMYYDFKWAVWKSLESQFESVQDYSAESMVSEVLTGSSYNYQKANEVLNYYYNFRRRKKEVNL